jgi:hypothetical protein
MDLGSGRNRVADLATHGQAEEPVCRHLARRRSRGVWAHPKGTTSARYARAATVRTVDAPVSLLHASRVPGHVEVEEVSAEALEVHALAGGVGGEENADGMLVRLAVEGPLDLLALLV